MYSEVDIVNIALNTLGRESIRDLSTSVDDPKTGRISKRLYTIARDTLIQGHDWSFARDSQELQVVADTHPEGVLYKVPSDCFVPRRIYPRSAKPNKWVLMQRSDIRVILLPDGHYSEYGTVPILRYTKQVTLTSLFSPMFVDALSLHLAARLCMPITRDSKYRKELQSEAFAMLRQAQFVDANSDSGDHNHEIDIEYDSFINPNGTGVTFYGE